MRYVRGTVVAAATIAGVAGVLALNPHAPVGALAATKPATPSAGATGGVTGGAAPTSPAAPAADAGRTYTGSIQSTPYGPIQVEATIAAGRVVDISWIRIPDDPHSARINGAAAPALVEEALAAQSAQVDSISGATYTSEGFRLSLQSILDEAGL